MNPIKYSSARSVRALSLAVAIVAAQPLSAQGSKLDRTKQQRMAFIEASCLDQNHPEVGAGRCVVRPARKRRAKMRLGRRAISGLPGENARLVGLRRCPKARRSVEQRIDEATQHACAPASEGDAGLAARDRHPLKQNGSGRA